MERKPQNAAGDRAPEAEAPYNAGEHSSVTKAKNKQAQRAENHKLVLESIMNNPRGRAWVFDFLAEAGVNRNPYAQNALAMAYACGEQNAGQKFQARIVSEFPELYVQMLTEGANDARSD